MKRRILIILVLIVAVLVGAYFWLTREHAKQPIAELVGPTPALGVPREHLIPTVNVPEAIGWPDGGAPKAAAGLRVNQFAAGLDHPRWMTLLPNGDVLLSETNSPPRGGATGGGGGIQGFVMGILFRRVGASAPSANRITLLRDADGDGVAEARTVLIGGLNSPHGVAVAGGYLYIANTDALVRVPFVIGQTKIDATPEKVVDLPGGGNHWARNVIANADGSKLYVTVGSATNIADGGIEAEKNRAAILEVDPVTKQSRLFAYGLRNPNGLAWEPDTNMLWTTVNERDMIGSDLVPDYMTSVQFGGFYGWPWYYWGGNVDKRVPPPPEDMAQYVIRPDYALGPHVAALGLSFSRGTSLGSQFGSGAFVGLHGSWNRKPLSGYKVIYVPFAKGRPAGKPIDILTGFHTPDEKKVWGRPVATILDKTGALLVSDDVGNRIWRVSSTAPTPAVPAAAAPTAPAASPAAR